MNFLKLILVLLFLGLDYWAIADMPDGYTQWLEKIEKYQKNVRVVITRDSTIYHYFIDGRLDTATFNIEEYMGLYSALQAKPGYIIDYANAYSHYSGCPQLFARDSKLHFDSLLNKAVEQNNCKQDSVFAAELRLVKEKKHLKRKDKEKRIWELNNRKRLEKWDRRKAKVDFARDSLKEAGHFLVPEDTPMGYFQLLVFRLIGDNFALYWHANYGFHFIIYKTEHLEKLVKANEAQDFSVSCDKEILKKLLDEDVTPQIQMEDDRCLITVYTFYAMSGIYKTTWSIARTMPYQVEKVKEEKLVKNEVRGFY